MSHYSLPQDTNFNFSSGIDQLFLYVADQVPIFFPTVLFAFFLTITLGGWFAQQRSEGRGEILMWMSVGSLLTSGMAFIMSITDGLVNPTTVIITITLTIVINVFYMLNNK